VPDVLFAIAVWLFAVLGVAALAWAFIRRVRSRACPRCSYSMLGVPSLTCPECGHTAKREKQLLRPRLRKRRIALAAVLFTLSYGAAVAPDVRSRGWPAAVPTVVLVLIAPNPNGHGHASSWLEMANSERQNRLESALPAPWVAAMRLHRVRLMAAIDGSLGIDDHHRAIVAALESTRLPGGEYRSLDALAAMLALETKIPCRVDPEILKLEANVQAPTVRVAPGESAFSVLERACHAPFHDALSHTTFFLSDGVFDGTEWIVAGAGIEIIREPLSGHDGLRTVVYDVRKLMSSVGESGAPVDHQAPSPEQALLDCYRLQQSLPQLTGFPSANDRNYAESIPGFLIVSATASDHVAFERVLTALETGTPLDSIDHSTKLAVLAMERHAGTYMNRDMPLEVLLRMIQSGSGVRIHADWDALSDQGLTPRTPVTLQHSGTWASYLDSILLCSKTNLYGWPMWDVSGDTVHISSLWHVNTHRLTNVYDVRDLTEAPPGTATKSGNVHDELITLLNNGLLFNVSSDAGFDGSDVIRWWDGRLVVVGTPRQHYAVTRWLANKRAEAKDGASRAPRE
jgi:hypothetical protein